MGEARAHHKLAHIGEEILLPALQKGNEDKDISIGAFYLGNWLADVSQTVDPVAYGSAASKIDTFRNRLEHWMGIAYMLGPDAGLIAQAVERVMAGIVLLLENGKEGHLAKGFRAVMFVIGYEKFVSDTKLKPSASMDPDIYFSIFDERFTQYFPHEHLDRPSVGNDAYDTRKPSSAGRGLYTYLEEQIEVAAGALSYLDAGKSSTYTSWAAASFTPGRARFIGRDGKKHEINSLEWNYSLAMLGHALHAVEDFFAHSIFVDLAYSSGTGPRLNEDEEEIVALRLMEWNIDENAKPKRDSHVATGYFDFFDTINSLLHLFEGLLDQPATSLATMLRDTLEQPEKLSHILATPPVSLLPLSVKAAFEDAVKTLALAAGASSIYKVLRDISDFISNPTKWLCDHFKVVLAPFIADWLKKQLYVVLGARRIGCHSLIAKDGAHACLYDAAMHCAGAVHWYVVHALTRHASRSTDVSRSASDTSSRNDLMAAAIDWHELLAYFLRHPLQSKDLAALGTRDVGVTIVHHTRHDVASIMSPDTLASLAKEYSSGYLPPPQGPKTLTWEVIADCNFGTRGMTTADRATAVNRALASHAAGVVVADGVNFAFKPNIPVLIPHQRVTISKIGKVAGSTYWWESALSMKGQTSGAAAHAYIAKFHTPKPVGLDDISKFHYKVLSLQNELRAAYGNGEALDWIF